MIEPAAPAHWWSILIPTDALGLWTAMLALSTIALVGAAIRGLRSLKLTRTEMTTRAKREARMCAIRRCEEYAVEMVPMNSRILSTLAGAKVPVFVKEPAEVNFGQPPSAAELQRAVTWVQGLPVAVFGESISLLNRMEAWAMYFTQGLADPDVASPPLSALFCSTVVQLYAIMLVLRSRPGSGGFPNVVTVFEEWYEKIEENKRGAKMTELLSQLEEMQAKGPGTKRLPDVLGTEPEG